MGGEVKRGWRAGEELPPVILGKALRSALHTVGLPEGSRPFAPADPAVAPLVLDLAVDVRPVTIRWLWPG